MQCFGFKTMQCNAIKSISSENTIIFLCIQRNRVSQVWALLSADVSHLFFTCKELQSFSFKFFKKKI